MSKKKPDYQIPFDSKGNQLHYPEDYSWNPVTRKDNCVFEDTLTFVRYARGRSAAYFIFKRLDGTEVVIFLTDICDMFNHFVNGQLTGKFTFCKRGANYGCKLVEVKS